MDCCNKEPWFALQVLPRHEQKVDALLEYRGYEHFLPTCRVSRKWSDRTKVMEEPLFPGYVFCRNQRSLMEAVHNNPAIIRIVNFGGKPYPVADEEIAAIQRVVRAERDVSSFPYTHAGLSAGQKVQVIAGPLAGVAGIITEFKKRERLVLSVNLIMKSVSVEIDRSEVSPLHAA